MDVDIPGSEDLWILGICGIMDVEVLVPKKSNGQHVTDPRMIVGGVR